MTDIQRERLKALSERTGLSVSELIRRFIDEGLRGEDRKSKKEDR